MAGPPCGRVELYLDVRRHAAVLNLPFAIESVNGSVRGTNVSAVHQRRDTRSRDQAAPGPLSYQRANVQLFKEPRHRVAARTGKLIDQHHLRAVDRAGRDVPVLAVAERDLGQLLPPEILDDVIGEQTAAIETLIDHGSLLVCLSKEIPVEARVAGAAGVRDVDVAEAAAAQAIDRSAIVLDPGEVSQTAFA